MAPQDIGEPRDRPQEDATRRVVRLHPTDSPLYLLYRSRDRDRRRTTAFTTGLSRRTAARTARILFIHKLRWEKRALRKLSFSEARARALRDPATTNRASPPFGPRARSRMRTTMSSKFHGSCSEGVLQRERDFNQATVARGKTNGRRQCNRTPFTLHTSALSGRACRPPRPRVQAFWR